MFQIDTFSRIYLFQNDRQCKGNCQSGQSECTELQCDKMGRCLGALAGVHKVESPVDCIKKCQETPNCLWYTYDGEMSLCTLTNDCLMLDKNCRGCMVSEKQCINKQQGGGPGGPGGPGGHGGAPPPQ